LTLRWSRWKSPEGAEVHGEPKLEQVHPEGLQPMLENEKRVRRKKQQRNVMD